MLNNIVTLVGHIAWPVAVVVLVFSFRGDIRKGINRVVSARLPGGAEFVLDSLDRTGKEEDGKTDIAHVSEGEYPNANWERVGHLYWLGHDLMWTVDALSRLAPKRYIVHGLRQSRHHMSGLGLENTQIHRSLSELFDLASETVDSEYSDEFRERLISAISRMIHQVGALAAHQQGDFRPT